MRKIILDRQALEDLKWWIKQDKRIALKIMELIESLPNKPFTGKGKPEKLKFNLSGFWSRRINKEHRLVYSVEEGEILIAQCRFH